MPRIPNYKRVKSNESSGRPYHWKHREKNLRVEVQKTSVGRGKWGVATSPPGISGYSVRKGGFSNKEAARSWAVNWMRDHP